MKDTRMRSAFYRGGFLSFLTVKFSILGVNMMSRSSSSFDQFLYIDLSASRFQLYAQDEGVGKAETP